MYMYCLNKFHLAQIKKIHKLHVHVGCVFSLIRTYHLVLKALPLLVLCVYYVCMHTHWEGFTCPWPSCLINLKHCESAEVGIFSVLAKCYVIGDCFTDHTQKQARSWEKYYVILHNSFSLTQKKFCSLQYIK